ncbi:MAG TPA: type II toxin-antitoxin system VapC family toxin [Solirubrobacteraceae bacterium]|jgi:predicted nucleic acid-binding protein|nr:type II toxin-antitoxin system VapC family toxin [Solirubrobacteraceae bacterium]
MLVVDASAVVDLLLQRPTAAAVEQHLAAHDFDLHAPALIDVEVLSALRRLVASRETSAGRAADAVDDLLDLPLERHDHTMLVPRVWQLRETIAAYDATYLALAETLSDAGCPVVTTDARFARAIARRSDVPALLVR